MRLVLALVVLAALLGCAQTTPHARVTSVEPLLTPNEADRPRSAVTALPPVDLPPNQNASTSANTSAASFGLAGYSSIPSNVRATGSQFPEFDNVYGSPSWDLNGKGANCQQADFAQPQSEPTWFTVLDAPGGAPQAVVLNDTAPYDVLPPSCSPPPKFTVFDTLLADQKNFYSCSSLTWLGAGLGVSAIFANTNLDQDIRSSVGGPENKYSTDLNWAKAFGSGQYVIPGLVGVFALDYCINAYGQPGEHPVAGWLQEWSGRSLRAMTVGAVPLLTLQYAIGSSRPGESSAGSRWTPFQDNNGVSGHAFVGAIPFWTAAQMTDSIPLQAGLYAMGTLPGISRIHTDSHYTSQVIMGWWLAGVSVAAVNHTEWQKNHWYVGPAMIDGAPGLTVMHEW
jgi:hypothetical protein